MVLLISHCTHISQVWPLQYCSRTASQQVFAKPWRKVFSTQDSENDWALNAREIGQNLPCPSRIVAVLVLGYHVPSGAGRIVKNWYSPYRHRWELSYGNIFKYVAHHVRLIMVWDFWHLLNRRTVSWPTLLGIHVGWPTRHSLQTQANESWTLLQGQQTKKEQINDRSIW